MRVIFGTILALCLAMAVSSDEDQARLLASKNVLNEMLVEGRDLTVEYIIYNVGSRAAHQVHLTDASFPESSFEIVKGSLDITWQRIAPNTNVTHAVILLPLQSGYVNLTAAEISYKSSEDVSEPQIGYTSSPGEGNILNYKEYDRRFSPHVLDWMVFAVMTLPSLGIPFILWHNSKSRYETNTTQSKPKRN